MATRKHKPNYKSSIAPAQSRSLPQASEAESNRENKRLLRNDAQVAVRVLNASSGSSAHKRLREIRVGLEALRASAAELQEISTGIDKEMFPEGMRGAGRSGTATHLELAARYRGVAADLKKQHVAINEQLSRYAFRPSVSYFMTTDEWRFGMVPDTTRKQFEMKIGEFSVTEADAVMAMVRLDATGQLKQVKLCEQCKKVWKVLRTIDRFCSPECSEVFRSDSKEYSTRKAANQRKYRAKKKEEDMKKDAVQQRYLKNL